MLQTDDPDTADLWCATLGPRGIEGLIIKPADSPYSSGRRDWLKYMVHHTTDAIVGSITGSLQRPEALLVGRYDSATGQLRFAGRTTPLTEAQARAGRPSPEPRTSRHPWPEELTITWQAEPVRYMRVQPTLVAEIRADVATDQRRWRHALRFLRIRAELRPEDVPTDLDTGEGG